MGWKEEEEEEEEEEKEAPNSARVIRAPTPLRTFQRNATRVTE